MNAARARKGVLLCTLALVAVMAVVGTRRAAPGPITNVHAAIEGTRGGNDCASCHGGWFTDMSAACLACHEAIGEHLRESRGLHGSFDRSEAVRCASCHSEHHGADFAMVNAVSFARAGVPERDDFDHVRVGFVMEGAHLELQCAECHEHADAPGLSEGQHRFLGLAQDCASCHEDPHEGRMQLDCTSCHGQASFAVLDSRGHERFLALDGAHGQLDCRACHAAEGPFALETVGPAGGADAPRDCASCHDSPHDGGFVQAAAALAGLTPGNACRVCHADEQRDFLQARAQLNPVHHELGGFSFAPPHDGLDCAACHDPALSFAERHPGRDADDCAACHADPHGGQFADSPRAEGGCIACHEREHFEPHAFDLARHAETALPLDGRHAEAECAACHERAGDDEPRAFAGTAVRCEACHADAHDGFFDGHADVRVASRGVCAVCHETESFAELPRAFDHGRWTGFEVRAAHAQADCASCHPRADVADDAGRRFGHAQADAAEAAACVACHADVHDGAFDAGWQPRVVDGREGCARCHEQTSFRAFPRGFDHRLWTGFALVGAHGGLDCRDCHGPATDVAHSLGDPLGDRCADCHADPHAGQFRVDGVVDCARCHRDTGRFADLRFDHERDARFALGEAHGALGCGACHETVDVSGTPVVRYRPLVTACVDCHGAPEDVLLRQPGARR